MKQVLIITYYWPPAGGPGVQRWLKFCTYLPKYGIKPIVYTAKNPSYPTLDYNLLSEVPENITVIKQPILEPYAWASLFSKKTKPLSRGIITDKKASLGERALLWIRGNVFIPDARRLWVKPSVRFLERYIRQNAIDTIITTGPPHSLHIIGHRLKQKLNTKWIADFRDPWTTISYQSKLRLSPYAYKKHIQLEKLILNTCDRIIVTSKLTKQEFSQKTNVPISVITNGYEPYTTEITGLTESFSVTHSGTLFPNRNPKILWQALSELCTEVDTFAKDLEIRLVGHVSDSIWNDLELYNLRTCSQSRGYVSHNKARELQQASQVLVLIEADTLGTRAIIPGKLFEYICAKRPIVAIGPKPWEVLEIIEDTESGYGFGYDDKDALKRCFKNLYMAYKSGSLKVYGKNSESYSREALTKVLAETILETI